MLATSVGNLTGQGNENIGVLRFYLRTLLKNAPLINGKIYL